MLPENQSEVLNDAVRYAIDGQRNLALSEIKSLPSDASDHGVHIWSAWLANSPSEAIESLQSVLSADPTNEAALAGMKWLYHLNNWTITEVSETELIADEPVAEAEPVAEVEPVAEAEPTTEVEPVSEVDSCLLYTSPSPRDQRGSRMPSSA